MIKFHLRFLWLSLSIWTLNYVLIYWNVNAVILLSIFSVNITVPVKSNNDFLVNWNEISLQLVILPLLQYGISSESFLYQEAQEAEEAEEA